MKTTQAFEALDGTLHHSREQAARHDVQKYIEELLSYHQPDFPDSAQSTYRLVASQISEQLAYDNALHKLFNSSLQATRDDAHAATDVAVGIPMQIEGATAFLKCDKCEWDGYCRDNNLCHIAHSAAQQEIANAEVQGQ